MKCPTCDGRGIESYGETCHQCGGKGKVGPDGFYLSDEDEDSLEGQAAILRAKGPNPKSSEPEGRESAPAPDKEG